MSLLLETHKVGIVPYRKMPAAGGEALQFLIHLPRPKKAEEASAISWGLARGTVGFSTDGGASYQDIPSRKMLATLSPEQIQDHWQAALKEAGEELGLSTEELVQGSVRDHGLLTYASENKAPYPIHFFSVEARPDISLEALKIRAVDAQNIAWKSHAEIIEMAASKGRPAHRFKAGYLPILEAIHMAISQA